MCVCVVSVCQCVIECIFICTYFIAECRGFILGHIVVCVSACVCLRAGPYVTSNHSIRDNEHESRQWRTNMSSFPILPLCSLCVCVCPGAML